MRSDLTPTPKYSAYDFTVNNITVMSLTSIPLMSLALPRLYVVGPILAVIFYVLILQSEITKHLLSSERWMKQLLFYVVPAIYVLGACTAAISANAARVYAVIGVFVITFLWRRCGNDYRRLHYKEADYHKD